jgi:hypothetical protein
MPLWADLGEVFAHDLQDYASSGPLDAISAFEHEFGRSKLIEKLAQTLLVDEARPAPLHRAFCSVPFDLVCTTNFDFLLERQYDLIPRHCTPLIDEDQLSITIREPGVALLKFHGDLHHPTRLVATEHDYDSFLDRYPLLATFLANLLITRTAVLIGYSLDDPDFRQIWQVLGERLSQSRRIAYALMVGAKSTDVTRFARRGVKVIDLPGSKSRYGDILADTFNDYVIIGTRRSSQPVRPKRKSPSKNYRCHGTRPRGCASLPSLSLSNRFTGNACFRLCEIAVLCP